VYATDGYIGRVEEFVMDPDSDNITHLVVREGHLWGRRDLSIGVSQIAAIEDSTVRLKLDKEAVAKLPEVPVSRSK
jgi:sporulation protein YlmC with PRC-barrel domain